MNRIIVFLTAVTLLLAACGSDGDPASSDASFGQGQTSAAVVPTTVPSDPLEGEWRQTYTCEDNVRTFVAKMHGISAESRRAMAETTGLSTALPGLIDYYIRDFAWGSSAETAEQLSPRALCAGAEQRTMIMRVANGQIVFLEEEGEAHVIAYELLNDHTLVMNDGGDIVD